MKHFSYITLHPYSGSPIGNILEEAKAIAQYLDCDVRFEFQGVTVTMDKMVNVKTSIQKVIDAVNHETKDYINLWEK